MPRLTIGNESIDLKDMSPAIIFGHADADGHLAAEQTRTNMTREGIEVRELIVGPETKNYKFWESTFATVDLREFRLAVVVDIAFSFRDTDQSVRCLLRTVECHAETHFLVIDHHPLNHSDNIPNNLSLIQVDSAYDCCVGTPSDELMVVAAICDGDAKVVKPRTLPEHVKRATGIRRAAADIGGIAGSTLLSLIRDRNWDFFEALATEPAECHRNVRGRRVASGQKSPLLESMVTARI